MTFGFLNDLMVIFYLSVVGSMVSLVVYIIVALCNLGSKGSGTFHSSYSTRSHSYSDSSSYSELPMRDWESERILASIESEMNAHNARVEQMMKEQHRTMIENESRRISESINRPLSEQFDTRLTNIFRNPWEGIL